MAVSLLFVQFHVLAQAPLPPTNAPATNAPVLTLVPPAPPSATLEYDSGSPTNHFYLIVADQLAGSTVTFSNLTPGVEYKVIATTVDSNGVESQPTSGVRFILPANTPILSLDSAHAIIRATVMQASTLQTSPDLINWMDYAALQTNCINTWPFLLADSPQKYFRLNLNPSNQ